MEGRVRSQSAVCGFYDGQLDTWSFLCQLVSHKKFILFYELASTYGHSTRGFCLILRQEYD